jgi:proteasome assembly chaperone (PAC2) family protein
MLYLHANLQLMFNSSVICIGGLPGIGSVGKVAADYLATALECSTAKQFFSKGFPAQVVVTGNVTSLLHAELKAVEIKDGNDLFVLSGDAQPLEIREMYSLAGDILEYARSHNVTDIITLAAYVGDSKEKVMGAASNPETAVELQKSGIALLRSGSIGGLNGLLAGLAPLYGMRSFCLLATTSGEKPIDLMAARNLLEALLPLVGVEISLEGLAVEELEVVSQCEDVDMYYR